MKKQVKKKEDLQITTMIKIRILFYNILSKTFTCSVMCKVYSFHVRLVAVVRSRKKKNIELLEFESGVRLRHETTMTQLKSDTRKRGNERASNVISVSPQVLKLQKKLEEKRALRTKI
ncbi:cilia- and flagella-associated protein 99-like [Vespula squamosa]|uniref:Cilia- and flagella-associated protein 99-like n=1 Tax=Vespula squamosa TaxID=30214 RepID=A0ABD2B9Q5_VESSQ